MSPADTADLQRIQDTGKLVLALQHAMIRRDEAAGVTAAAKLLATSPEEFAKHVGPEEFQLRRAAQPLDRHEADTVIAALEQDTFGFGLWTRLANRYGNCATTRALDAFSGSHGKDSPQETVRALLARRKTQLDQIRRHMKIKAMLEVWLFIHIPVTIALLAALTAHIISVFYYW